MIDCLIRPTITKHYSTIKSKAAINSADMAPYDVVQAFAAFGYLLFMFYMWRASSLVVPLSYLSESLREPREPWLTFDIART